MGGRVGGKDRKHVAERDGGTLAYPCPAAADAARLIGEISGCGSVSFWLSGLLG